MRVALLACGCGPIAAGAVAPAELIEAGPGLCPFLAVTGLPCPFCGATRAFVAAGHLDGRVLDYNVVWVAVAVVVVVVASAGWRPRLTPWHILPALALPWAWALTHAGTIA